MNQEVKQNVREMTHLERYFSLSPYALVAVIARVKGNISEKMLIDAVSKVQQRHQNLRVRIEVDDNHILWFTSEGVKEIPVEIRPRESDKHWEKILEQAYKNPFEFDTRPAIRFILVQSPTVSELIILCHHIICDGMSLAYLARDLMVHLGDPNQDAEVLPDPVPMDKDNIPKDVKVNGMVKYFTNRINKKWQIDKVIFDQEDYRSINEAYWNHFSHKMIPIELSETETTALVDRCRKEEVTVNSALGVAFVGGQYIVQGDKPYHSSITIAGSMRNRLPNNPGEAMGFFAGVVTLDYKYKEKIGFWENARKFHRKATPSFTNKNLLKEYTPWLYLDPSILEAINFKRLGGFVSQDSLRFHKLSSFSRRNDIVSSLLKRNNMDSLNGIIMGTAVTNLTRMDFSKLYGSLELDRLFMQPGGAIPLVNVNLVLGAVTCSGKLSLVIEYAEEVIETKTMEKIIDQAMEFLSDGEK